MASGAALAVEKPSAPRRLLHVGCGTRAAPEDFAELEEVRCDVDPGVNPHIVADMTDLRPAGEGYHAVYCSHALEHVAIDDAMRALREFRRVLVPGGAAIIIVPDLEGILPTAETVYVCDAGEITGLDMYYGFLPTLKSRPYMTHRCGFIARSLKDAMTAAGFERVATFRTAKHSLVGVGYK